MAHFGHQLVARWLVLAEVLSKLLDDARLAGTMPNKHDVGSTRQYSGDVFVVLSTALVAAMPVMFLSLANMMMFNAFIRSAQMHHLTIVTVRYVPDIAVITCDRRDDPFPRYISKWSFMHTCNVRLSLPESLIVENGVLMNSQHQLAVVPAVEELAHSCREIIDSLFNLFAHF